VKTRRYEAAGLALKEFLKRWPNSQYREDVLFSILQAERDLAANSVDSKKLARLDEAIRGHNAYVDAYPDTMRADEAKALFVELTDMRERALIANMGLERDLAIQSIKDDDRNDHLEAALRYYGIFARDFPQSTRQKAAEQLRAEVQELKERPARP
jgi:outer membrane protein assembly factor BamD